MNRPEEHAEAVLLRKLEELYPELSRELLLTCYRIEKEHQFEGEAELPLAQLRRVVNSALDDEPNPLSSRRSGGNGR